ncbi:hypothetical protein BDZ45DRAFT_811900 [Acephala macrosclerotiorum]|nr:hypothetical protein BDZ45DRAFT_811900 [Acephala macrosclerotiorum]
MEDTEARAARSLKIMHYLNRIEKAILARNKAGANSISVATAIANTDPLENKMMLSPDAVGVSLRVCNGSLVARSLARIALAIKRPLLRTILSTIDFQLSTITYDRVLSLAEPDLSEPPGMISRCHRCHKEIYPTTAHSILSFCISASEETTKTRDYLRFTSLSAKRVYSPCLTCLENEVCYDLDTTCTCIYSYLPPSEEKKKTGRHCKTCFDELCEEMKRDNVRQEVRPFRDYEEFPLLEYTCDCGEESGPRAPRICRLCYGICKPYTLNRDNRILTIEMGIPKVSSFEHTGKVPWGWGNDDAWGPVGNDWDNGFCGYFLKLEFFPESEVEHNLDDDDDDDDNGDSSSAIWQTTDEELSIAHEVSDRDEENDGTEVRG